MARVIFFIKPKNKKFSRKNILVYSYDNYINKIHNLN